MAKVLMIQGTTSNAGKSLVTAALCRIFAQDGYRVAPFKSQNMALNSYITADGLEMGRAQVVQAQAAFKEPDIRMNPILLKPTSDEGSQVIVNGEVIGNMTAVDYFKYKKQLIPHIMKAYDSLAAENDIIVIEGAGSPAEINLKEQDIVNMGMAKMAGAPVLIVGDIDRGGVFASLYGTYMLQSEDEKIFIKGNIINKFRGDIKILEPGLKMLEDLIPVPVVGVIPFMHLDIDDEDSLSDRFSNKTSGAFLDIAVIQLPRIANFTDFNAFDHLQGSKVRYVRTPGELKNPDLIIVPGTKNTFGDMKWLRESGLEASILKYANAGKPVFGICGGYQMLGNSISDSYHVEEGGDIKGMGLLDADTILEKEKVRTRVSGIFKNAEGIFKNLNGKTFEGYEIHMGMTRAAGSDSQTLFSDHSHSHTSASVTSPFTILTTNDGAGKQDGINKGNIYGSYVHGIFDSSEVLDVIGKALCDEKGISFDKNNTFDIHTHRQNEYNKLAGICRQSLDMKFIYHILEEGM